MTSHYFEHPLVSLHYYQFGSGPEAMLCFHGFGMHGRQFRLLEGALGERYTFYGFDLFFHKETRLRDQSLPVIKAGLQKKALAELMLDFCREKQISRFSVIGYSMGSHYATTLVEEVPEKINEYIIAAPSSINPGRLVRYFGKSSSGNKILQWLTFSPAILFNMLNGLKWLRVIDEKAREILRKEIETPELRFALYACFTYLRHLETDEGRLIEVLTNHPIKSIFIFGKRDKMYLPDIGKTFFSKYRAASVIVLDENHDMINWNFVARLTELLT